MTFSGLLTREHSNSAFLKAFLKRQREHLLRAHVRRLYRYSDADVIEYCQGLTRYGSIVTDVPDIRGVVRDPNDDMIIACAVGAGADYIVTRDKDLLSLGEYEGIRMIKPETFLHVLRART